MPCKEMAFRVGMTCDGCKNAVSRILSKTEGVSSFSCDVPAKSVIVTGTVGKDVLIEKISKWATAADKEFSFLSEKEISV